MTPSKYFLPLLFLTAAADACDLCGCALVQHRDILPRVGWYAGANEQFTRYNTMQEDGHTIDNDARQKLDSSITQTFLGYNITPSFGVQVNTPWVYRKFRRSEESGIDEGSVGGLGDVSVIANWTPVMVRTDDYTFSIKLTGGLKFPTGDSARVKEEAKEADAIESGESLVLTENTPIYAVVGYSFGSSGVVPIIARVGEVRKTEKIDVADQPESGIHGHDLALGTGSLDGIVGGSIYARWKRVFFAAEVQYAIRGQGKYDYDFANDLLWSGGPGVKLIEKDTHTVSIQCTCSGETKGEDKFRGVRADDTSATNVFLGPKITGTWRDRFTADVQLDVPIFQKNSGVQIMPDYRLHAGVSWAF